MKGMAVIRVLIAQVRRAGGLSAPRVVSDRRKMKALKILWCPFLLFSALPGMAAEGPTTLGGYYKNFSVVLVPPGVRNAASPYAGDSPLGLVNNRLRLHVSTAFKQILSFALAYDLSPRIQDPSLFDQPAFIADINPYHYRATDLHSRLYPSKKEDTESFGLFQNLDRAFLTLKTGWADLDIGRQAIAWGSARAVNPTDVIAPFTFEDLDTEDRIGVDAVRLRIPMGFMGELDAGAVFGKDFQYPNSAWYLRGKFYFAKTDMSLLLVDFQENMLAGIDLARSIGGAGGWCEAAYVIADGFRRLRIDQPTNYFRATVGVDYHLNDQTYGFIEYHFNGAGGVQPEHYLDIFNNPAISRGCIYLMGRHYLIPGATCQLTPLTVASGQILINLGDRSLFAAPQVEYNISENIYLSAGVYWSLGGRPEYRSESGLPPVMTLQSEFGVYPDMFYSSFRIYF
ncbi:hypothetical protein JW906_13775 [bacterium]|nr:hypothetical protein [bacterium]